MKEKHWARFIWPLLGLVLVACTAPQEQQVAAIPTAFPLATPTPTHTPTLASTTPPVAATATLVVATPPPTPTILPEPTRELLAFVPVDGGGGEVVNLRNDNSFKEGRNITLPGVAQSEVSEPMVFGDQIVFQVEVWDKSAGTADGEGIRHVEFVIRDGEQVVHERTEYNAGYCVFGGGEPDCVVWVFGEHGDKWPSGYPVREGVRYDVSAIIVADSGETADWMWSFQVDLPW